MYQIYHDICHRWDYLPFLVRFFIRAFVGEGHEEVVELGATILSNEWNNL